ncbi:replicative DNA helicase [Pseudomonas phage nickie]|uniref:Replicative DNA helicase n=1 Tax=Pseudomonas phage nickie TaxID=2048977 RepID=A0A2H4P718_9CAUD|nr:DnaB-like replicative helicase [Pseudomonas phage nickie]ATW57982.1 replicative DNA helicase [Pseudomonas phage nickie]
MSEEAIKDSLAEQMARQMGIVEEEVDLDLDDELENVMQAAKRITPLPTLEEGAKAFEFEADFQQKIAALMLRDEAFYRRTDGLVKAEYFESRSLSALVHICSTYHEKYRRLPERSEWAELIKDAKAEKAIRDDDVPDMVADLKKILVGALPARDYAVDKVAEFAKKQAISAAYMMTIPLVEKGEHAKAEKIMQKAFATGAQAVVEDNDYWNSIESRTQYRRDVEAGLIQKDGITSGLPKLDKMLYHNGWGRKELSVVMGGAKKGKSTGLLHWALAGSQKGFNVLYVTLEVAAKIIMERMDANVSGVDMADLNARGNDVEKGVKDRAGLRKPGHLKVVEYPSGQMTCSDLRKVIEFYRAEGIIFDMIVVDYADIMAAEIKSGNDINESKQVWLGLRAIAHEENAAVLTATQTNRAGFTADVAKAEHAAEDFNKIRIADLVLTINRTDEEKAKGEARIYFAASRNQAGEFTLKISQELSKMRFMTGILEIT